MIEENVIENVRAAIGQITRFTNDSLVVSALDHRPRGRRFESSAGRGQPRSNRGPVALCTLGLGLFNPPSFRGR